LCIDSMLKRLVKVFMDKISLPFIMANINEWMVMSRTDFINFSLKVAIITVISIAGVFASDGDVNYSAPYITVDPETGKLITVNPGPELKMHTNTPMPAATPATATVPLPSGLSDRPALRTGTGQNDGLVFKISVIAAIIIAILALAGWRIRQNQSKKQSL